MDAVNASLGMNNVNEFLINFFFVQRVSYVRAHSCPHGKKNLWEPNSGVNISGKL